MVEFQPDLLLPTVGGEAAVKQAKAYFLCRLLVLHNELLNCDLSCAATPRSRHQCSLESSWKHLRVGYWIGGVGF